MYAYLFETANTSAGISHELLNYKKFLRIELTCFAIVKKKKSLLCSYYSYRKLNIQLIDKKPKYGNIDFEINFIHSFVTVNRDKQAYICNSCHNCVH